MYTNERTAMLVNQTLAGDSSAFEELYQATYKGVFFHAQKILKNEQDVEDVVSETYIRAYEQLAKLQDPAQFQAWVNRIATNFSLNMVRDDRYRNAQSLDDEEFYYEPVASDDDTPSMVLDRKGTEEIVGGMIEALPEVQRTTVIMYYYDEMNVSAIAGAMGCSEGTVKSRLNYARKNLERAVLAEEKRGVKLYSVSPTLVFSAIGLLIKSVDVPPSSFVRIGEIIAGLGGVAEQASGAGVATAGGTAASSGTATAVGGSATATGSSAATAVETGASAGIKAGAAAKAAAATGGAVKTALTTKIAAGVLAASIAVGGVAVAVSSSSDLPSSKTGDQVKPTDNNEMILQDYQRYVKVLDKEINSITKGSVTPEMCRYAVCDADGDGTIDLFFVYEYENTLNDRTHAMKRFSGRRYDKQLKHLSRFFDFGIETFNQSIGMSSIEKDGKQYSGLYNHNMYSGYRIREDGEVEPIGRREPYGSITWTFMSKSSNQKQSGKPIYDYYFTYNNISSNNTMMPVEDTSLFVSIPDDHYTEPEFDLTDEEFYSLIDNCVKIIGFGPEFEGQDLSMSYDEFMALKSIDDAPKPGEPSQSSLEIAAASAEMIETTKTEVIEETEAKEEITETAVTAETAETAEPEPIQEPEQEQEIEATEDISAEKPVVESGKTELENALDSYRMVLSEYDEKCSPLVNDYWNAYVGPYYETLYAARMTREESLNETYAMLAFYFLYDLTGDNIPELITQYQNNPGTMCDYDIFEYNPETCQAEKIGEGSVDGYGAGVLFSIHPDGMSLYHEVEYRGTGPIYLMVYNNGSIEVTEESKDTRFSDSFRQSRRPKVYAFNDDSGLNWIDNNSIELRGY